MLQNHKAEAKVTRNIWLKKSFICGIIVLLVGASLIPGISGDVEQKKDITQMNEPRSAPSSTTDWWSMFHHDPNHSGYSTSRAPKTNDTLWTSSIGNEIKSSPCVVNGKVYVGSATHRLSCLDADTGVLIWEFLMDFEVYSSPAVVNGKVYIGSYYGKVHCLNADTGAEIWNYTINDNIVLSSPTVINGKVYICAYNWRVYCLNADTGEEIWDHRLVGVSESSPTIVNGKVYVGTTGSKVYCLNSDSGAELWNYTTGNQIVNSPAVINGKLYCGSCDYNVYCLNPDTGEMIWSFTTGSSIVSSPAVANGKVYIGSRDNKLYCLNTDNGTKIWDYTTGGSIESSPAVADGNVYVGSNDHWFYCVDAMNGNLLWNYETRGLITASPAITNEKVYIGSNDGTVYCFGQPNLSPVANFSYDINDLSVTFDASSSYDPDGNISSWLWNYGDDTNGSGEITTHNYDSSRTYNVTLTVIDNLGANASITKSFAVKKLQRAFIFGTITNLSSQGEYIQFEAVKTRMITFSPFSFITYVSGEKFAISKDYKGLVGARYIFALCKILI